MGQCEKCQKAISEKVEEYSMSRFGKPLCYDCQKLPENQELMKKVEESKNGEGAEEQQDEITLHGKKFITHTGLLKKAHAAGLKEIYTEMLPEMKDGTILFKAIVTIKDKDVEKDFTAHGDANDTNVSGEMKQHKIRLAETRAISRALRLATGHGTCSAEELGGKEEEVTKDEQVLKKESQPVQG